MASLFGSKKPKPEDIKRQAELDGIRARLQEKRAFLDLLHYSSAERLNSYYTSNNLRLQMQELAQLSQKARQLSDSPLADEIYKYVEAIESALKRRNRETNNQRKEGKPPRFYGRETVAAAIPGIVAAPAAAAGPMQAMPMVLRENQLFKHVSAYRNAMQRGYSLNPRNKAFLQSVKAELDAIETRGWPEKQRNSLRNRYTRRLKPLLNYINQREEEARLNAELERLGISNVDPINDAANALAKTEEASIDTELGKIIERAVNNSSHLNKPATKELLTQAITLLEKKKNPVIYEKVAQLIAMKQASGTGGPKPPGGAGAQGGKRKSRRSRRRTTRRRRA